MRALFLGFPLLLASCGSRESQQTEPQEQASSLQTFAGAGRDGLCLQPGGTAAFITYGDSDANCSVRGRHDASAGSIVPDGDDSCRIPVAVSGDEVRLGQTGPACAYYCGPGASFADRRFRRTPDPQPVRDLAGEPLC